MSTTLTLDPSGGLFVPATLLERAHLLQGRAVTVDIEHDRLVVTSAQDILNQDVPDSNLVRKGRIQVFTGLPESVDAVTAVEQTRVDRDEQILAHRNGA